MTPSGEDRPVDDAQESGPELRTEVRDEVAVIVLDAPQRRNALSPRMREALRDALRAAIADRAVRAIVLTGAQRTFSAGGDIRHMAADPDPLLARERLEVLHDTVRMIVDGPKPVVAAVEGHAFGAGFSLACACDHVVAAEGASFGAAFGRIGLVADCGLLWTLPQRIGLGAARDLLLTGRPFGAAEAARLGIVDTLVSDGGALAAALEKAAAYRAVGPLAIAATKSALARRPASLEDALAIEADLQAALRVSDDHLQAAKAFLEKRRPVFRGR